MDPNINLKGFYLKSKKKILLNFTSVDTTSDRIKFINKNTAPNMPVWAAILASSSFSFLFK